MMSVKCDSFFNHLKNFKCNTCNFISDYAVFSKVVDVFYSTLRARITSKKDHQVLIDRVMNLGCKRTKLLCNLAAGGFYVKSKWFFLLKVAKILLKISYWNSATLDISVLDSCHL